MGSSIAFLPARGAVIVSVLMVSLAGCAPVWSPLDPAALSQAKPRTLLLVLRPTNHFHDGNPGTGRGFMFDALAEAWSLNKGQTIRDMYALVDPSPVLGTELAKAVAQQYGLELTVVTENETAPVLADSVRRTQTTPPPSVPVEPPRPESDLLLEVRTYYWSLEAFPPYIDHYRVRYAVTAKLTDRRNQQVLAIGNCVGDDPEGEPETSPKWKEMLDNGAAVLKRELDRATKRCRARFHNTLLYTSAPKPVIANPASLVTPAANQPSHVDGGVADAGADGG